MRFIQRIGREAGRVHPFGRPWQHLKQQRIARVAWSHPGDEPPRHEQRKRAGGTACIVTGTDKSLRYVSLSPSSRPAPEKAAPQVAAVAAVEAVRVTDSLAGNWRLSEVSSGASCSVSLQPSEGTRPGSIRFAPDCHAIALPQGLSVWKRDLGSLRFAGADAGHSLHFSPMGGGKWMSPNQATAVILSRAETQRAPAPTAAHRGSGKPAPATHRGRGRMHR
jgi:hypothetical protein